MTKKFQILNPNDVVHNWTVVLEYGMKNRVRHYLVRCKCGAEAIKSNCQIHKNKECYKCSRARQTLNGGTRRSHGACSSTSDLYKTYQAWHYMKRRCQGKNPKDKKNYPDRGITVCPHWLISFQNFFADMGRRPDFSSLERIDNDKGYSKENCKWATITEQNDNKRGCIYYSHEGQSLTIARWAEKWGITRSKAAEWLKREGIEWVVANLEKIKKCKTGMSNSQYVRLGLNKRKGKGQRIHAASRDISHPLHKMYKSWDYMKHTPQGMAQEWHDFMKFVEDMGNKPIGKRLLRTFKHLPFSKHNCYWG